MPENKDDVDLEGWDLHRAAAANRVDIARSLIARGSETYKVTKVTTPLHRAAMNNSLDVARLLIEHGARIEANDNVGRTPLHYAAEHHFPRNVASLLIERGANTVGIDLSWMN